MQKVTIDDAKKLCQPLSGSHKGQNGRLLIIGGSRLFHAASLWSLTVASRIVDLVHYASVPENNEIVQKAKEEFRNGIVIPREAIEEYIKEDDVILIGPGMMRSEKKGMSNVKFPMPNQVQISNIKELEKIQDEGVQTEAITNYLLAKYPEKQWVIDAGALQMMDVSLIPKHAILTPHYGEFEHVFGKELAAGLRSGQNFLDPLLAGQGDTKMSGATAVQGSSDPSRFELGKRSAKILSLTARQDAVTYIAKKHYCIVLLKGEQDIACNGGKCRVIEGGNPGMTKGGTGDVLAGLIAALACKNDPFFATIAGSFINKKAGDELYKTAGPYFNATDLANQIPITMKELIF